MQRFKVHSHSQAVSPTHRSLQPVASSSVQFYPSLVQKTPYLSIVIAEVMVELKVVIKGKVHVQTVEPATHLNNVLPLERGVIIVV